MMTGSVLMGKENVAKMNNVKIEQKWNKIKKKTLPCPNCNSERLWLNHSLFRKWKPYWVECADCHWCGKHAQTIKIAVWWWNRDKKRSDA